MVRGRATVMLLVLHLQQTFSSHALLASFAYGRLSLFLVGRKFGLLELRRRVACRPLVRVRYRL